MQNNINIPDNLNITKDVAKYIGDALLQLYSIRQLSKFGIGEHELRSWYNEGVLIPTTYAGSQPRFTYNDMLEAAKSRKSLIDTKENKLKDHISHSSRNNKKVFEKLEKKFLKKA